MRQLLLLAQRTSLLLLPLIGCQTVYSLPTTSEPNSYSHSNLSPSSNPQIQDSSNPQYSISHLVPASPTTKNVNAAHYLRRLTRRAPSGEGHSGGSGSGDHHDPFQSHDLDFDWDYWFPPPQQQQQQQHHHEQQGLGGGLGSPQQQQHHHQQSEGFGFGGGLNHPQQHLDPFGLSSLPAGNHGVGQQHTHTYNLGQQNYHGATSSQYSGGLGGGNVQHPVIPHFTDPYTGTHTYSSSHGSSSYSSSVQYPTSMQSHHSTHQQGLGLGGPVHGNNPNAFFQQQLGFGSPNANPPSQNLDFGGGSNTHHHDPFLQFPQGANFGAGSSQSHHHSTTIPTSGWHSGQARQNRQDGQNRPTYLQQHPANMGAGSSSQGHYGSGGGGSSSHHSSSASVPHHSVTGPSSHHHSGQGSHGHHNEPSSLSSSGSGSSASGTNDYSDDPHYANHRRQRQRLERVHSHVPLTAGIGTAAIDTVMAYHRYQEVPLHERRREHERELENEVRRFPSRISTAAHEIPERVASLQTHAEEYLRNADTATNHRDHAFFLSRAHHRQAQAHLLTAHHYQEGDPELNKGGGRSKYQLHAATHHMHAAVDALHYNPNHPLPQRPHQRFNQISPLTVHRKDQVFLHPSNQQDPRHNMGGQQLQWQINQTAGPSRNARQNRQNRMDPVGANHGRGGSGHDGGNSSSEGEGNGQSKRGRRKKNKKGGKGG